MDDAVGAADGGGVFQRSVEGEVEGGDTTICGRGDCRAGDDLWHTVCVKVCDKGDLLVVVVDKACAGGCQLIIASVPGRAQGDLLGQRRSIDACAP